MTYKCVLVPVPVQNICSCNPIYRSLTKNYSVTLYKVLYFTDSQLDPWLLNTPVYLSNNTPVNVGLVG